MAFTYSVALIIVAVIVLVIGRRVISGRRGAKYSVQSIFITPFIYIVLTAALIIGVQIWQIGVIAAVVIIGVFAGMKLGKRSNIFEKDEKVMYRRSNEVLAIWVVAFIARIIIEFFTDPYLTSVITGAQSLNSTGISAIFLSSASQSNPILFAADILLAFSAGLLFGEALILYNEYNARYKKGSR